MPQDQKTIYLTFDDGPTPEITQWTLDLLKSYEAKATFFCIGNNIVKHPKLFRNILKEGHAVGNHTYSHPKGWHTKSNAYIKEVINTQEIIKSQSVHPLPKLFRPPYGQITSQQAKPLLSLGYKIIMWDILAFDWKAGLSKEQCANNVTSKTRSGSIVVFHDSVKAAPRMKFALTRTLEHFSQQGYTFKGIKY